MEAFFKFATPIVYGLLIIVWALISIFYFKKIKELKGYGKFLKLLLIILAIDAARSFFESLYFGAWHTSFSGILPISIYNFLSNPIIFFIPKIINLIIAILILFLIIKKWFKYELVEINEAFDKQGCEIKKLSVVVEQSANSIIITDLKGNITYTNPRFTKITGYTAEEVLGKKPNILNSGQQSKEFYSNMWEIISGGEIWSGEFKNKKKNGKFYWEEVTISSIKNDAGEIINYLAIKNDISELRESEKAYKDVVETSTDLITVVDGKGKILFVNHASKKFYGLLPEECIGKSAFNFILPEDKEFTQTKFIEWINSEKDNFHIENRQISTCGEIFDTEWNIIIERKEKEIIKITSIGRDITKQKSTQKELIEAKERAEEGDRLKTEFLNNMSHEIRTPMNGIMGFSELLNDTDISEEKRANFIRIIQSSGQQLLNVIDDILEISRLGTKQVKVIESDVCLNDVLLELFSTFDLKAKEQKNPLYLKKALSDKQSTIRTDSTKLNKILSNLLENALKFTNEGFIEFGYQLQNNDIELYVKDTGIGIEKSKHESIFERFSQAEKDLSKNVGGLGLGLSIAKENTELLGGSIHLESKEGKGSTFFVTIPYKPVYKVTDIEKSKTEYKYTILIAEDEEVNYLYIETLIKDVFGLDCIIIHVTNGKNAIEACKENKTIDLVLMDLKMPILNGFEATKLIKKLRPNLPIIAQTAYSTAQDKEKAISVGCDFFISKPINQESFKNILDKYLIK